MKQTFFSHKCFSIFLFLFYRCWSYTDTWSYTEYKNIKRKGVMKVKIIVVRLIILHVIETLSFISYSKKKKENRRRKTNENKKKMER